jgi:hypothetical protein
VNNVVNKVSYLNLPPSLEELRSPCVATHDVGFGGCWVVTFLAFSAGSASMLKSNLVAMGPTIVIVFGIVKVGYHPRPGHWFLSGAGAHCHGLPSLIYVGLEFAKGQGGRSESCGGVLQLVP